MRTTLLIEERQESNSSLKSQLHLPSPESCSLSHPLLLPKSTAKLSHSWLSRCSTTTKPRLRPLQRLQLWLNLVSRELLRSMRLVLPTSERVRRVSTPCVDVVMLQILLQAAIPPIHKLYRDCSKELSLLKKLSIFKMFL